MDACQRCRANSRGNRENLPIELWEEINRFWLEFRRDPDGFLEANEWCSMLRRRCQSIVGTADSTWMRSDPWTYFTIGRLLERSLLTAGTLRIRHPHHTAGRTHEWMTTLRCCSALQAHRRQYPGFGDPRSIIALLVHSETAPRSVNFCVGHLEDAIVQLGAPANARSRRVIGQLAARLRFSDPVETPDDEIDVLLAEIETELKRFGAALAAEFFLLPLENGLRSLRLGAVDSVGGVA